MKYFEKERAMAKAFGFPYEAPTSMNAKTWLDKIENELSPENLTCDGELRGAQLKAKQKNLMEALDYLTALYPPNRPVTGYNFFEARATLRAERTVERNKRLHEAVVNDGKVMGAWVKLSNGYVGKIVKINKTRFKVETQDGRIWAVPPTCCTVVQK